MDSKHDFCTCSDHNCPLHPTNHEKGCAPCIGKNRRLREIPSCFFNLLEKDDGTREHYTFEAFAALVQQQHEEDEKS